MHITSEIWGAEADPELSKTTPTSQNNRRAPLDPPLGCYERDVHLDKRYNYSGDQFLPAQQNLLVYT